MEKDGESLGTRVVTHESSWLSLKHVGCTREKKFPLWGTFMCLHEIRHLLAQVGRFDGDWRRGLACPSHSASCWDDSTWIVCSLCAEMLGRVL